MIKKTKIYVLINYTSYESESWLKRKEKDLVSFLGEQEEKGATNWKLD